MVCKRRLSHCNTLTGDHHLPFCFLAMDLDSLFDAALGATAAEAESLSPSASQATPLHGPPCRSIKRLTPDCQKQPPAAQATPVHVSDDGAPPKMKRRKPEPKVVMLPLESRRLPCMFVNSMCVPLWPQYKLSGCEKNFVKIYYRELWFTQVIHGARCDYVKRVKDTKSVKAEKEVADTIFEMIGAGVRNKILRGPQPTSGVDERSVPGAA